MEKNRGKIETNRHSIVVNTSVIISAAISARGGSFKILKLINEKKVTIYVSEEMFDEYISKISSDVLSKYIPLNRGKIIISIIKSNMQPISPKLDFSQDLAILKRVKDLSDIKFLNAVYASKAKFLISLDKKHILSLRNPQTKTFKLKEHDFFILTPEEFLESLDLE